MRRCTLTAVYYFSIIFRSNVELESMQIEDISERDEKDKIIHLAIEEYRVTYREIMKITIGNEIVDTVRGISALQRLLKINTIRNSEANT